ncbi:MAG: hypothetical protein ACE5JD_07330 [Candidatus Methylomirabilia bacterium]
MLRESPRAFLLVAVAGKAIVGIALAEVHHNQGRRVGTVYLLASFVEERIVNRGLRLALLSRLQRELKALGIEEIEVLGTHDNDFLASLEKAGYRLERQGGGPLDQGGRIRRRLAKSPGRGSRPWGGASPLA